MNKRTHVIQQNSLYLFYLYCALLRIHILPLNEHLMRKRYYATYLFQITSTTMISTDKSIVLSKLTKSFFIIVDTTFIQQSHSVKCVIQNHYFSKDARVTFFIITLLSSQNDISLAFHIGQNIFRLLKVFLKSVKIISLWYVKVDQSTLF